jgi:hypothetical protein
MVSGPSAGDVPAELAGGGVSKYNIWSLDLGGCRP